MKTLITLSVLLCSHTFYSQEKTVTIFFDFDKHSISNENIELIRNEIANINQQPITIKGYADFIGASNYNQWLSRKRVEAVIRLINQENDNSSITIAKSEFNGEVTKFGERKNNRRVDITYTPKQKEEIIEVLDTAKEVVDEVAPEPIIDENTEVISEIGTLAIGESIAVENMEFIGGRHYLQSYSVKELTKLENTLKAYPSLKIEIQGHICCETEEFDGLDWDTGLKNLSTARAESVYNYLISKGINKDRLTFKGYGRSKPLVEIEKTDKDRQKNRRVEILILDK